MSTDMSRGAQRGKMKKIVELLENKDNKDEQQVKSVLDGKLWTDKSFNMRAFMTTIKRVWNSRKGVEDMQMGKKNSYSISYQRKIGFSS